MNQSFDNIELAIPVYVANAYSAEKDYPTDPDRAELVKSCRRNLESFVGGALKKKFNGKYCFLLPIAISAGMADICSFGTGFDSWAKDDYTWITICSELWVLVDPFDAWKKSVGVQAEIKYAKWLGRPVRYVSSTTLEFISEEILS